MPSIEGSGFPLAFKLPPGDWSELPGSGEREAGKMAVRACVRALTGMQKEAVVHYGPTGATWRMVSDEGPYLNGTDLAPFPLAFYTAGMAFSFMAELLRHAVAHHVPIESLKLIQDNFYTMEGSALRGDMIGGAKPVEIRVEIRADASQAMIEKLMRLAEQSSPAQAYMRDKLTNTFTLNFNGRQIPVTNVTASISAPSPDPEPMFETVRPLAASKYVPDIITKLKAAEPVFGVEGGAGSSLQAEQKRTLHVRGVGTLREDGLKEVQVQLFKPIGSTFRFISDEQSQSAPPSLAYLSAGVGFCYMTQMGRYAHIVKQDLPSYRIVQDNSFIFSGDIGQETLQARAVPVNTQVFVTMNESEEAAQKLVSMSERTCFLHAAMRTINPTKIEVVSD
ncbi:MAG: OsmC family peroxiredoxin [Anaerolineae bacterium]|nr:OsmC family peroxiredoxin [Anaerolineae bacterium]